MLKKHSGSKPRGPALVGQAVRIWLPFILISRTESVIVSLKKQAGSSFAFRLPCLATRAWSRAKPKMPRKAANSRCGRRKRKKRRGRRKGGRVLIPRGGGPGPMQRDNIAWRNDRIESFDSLQFDWHAYASALHSILFYSILFYSIRLDLPIF